MMKKLPIIPILFLASQAFGGTIIFRNSPVQSAPISPIIEGVFYSSITASWTQVASHLGYTLEGSSTNWNGTGSVYSSATTNGASQTLTVVSLSEGTTYYMKVGSRWNDGTTTYATTVPSSGTTKVAGGGTAGTFTNIQHKSCSAYTNTSNCAFDSNVTLHSLIVVGCVTETTANSVSVTDNNGNTYSTATVVTSGGGTRRVGIFYALNAAAGATTVTCHDLQNTASYTAQSIHEYGNDGAGTFDVASSSAPDVATANPIATAMNTTLDNEFVFAFTQDNGSVTGQSGTLRENYVDNYWQASQDTTVATAGSYQSSFTSVAGGSPWTMLQAAFK